MPRLGRLAFLFSRSRVGGLVVGTAFQYLHWLLPVRRYYNDEFVVVLFHPKPVSACHLVLVPKQPIRSLIGLFSADNAVERERLRHSILGAVNALQKRLPNGIRLFCNGGVRQDVAQIHWHMTDPTLGICGWVAEPDQRIYLTTAGRDGEAGPCRGNCHIVLPVDAASGPLPDTSGIAMILPILRGAKGFTFIVGDEVNGVYHPDNRNVFHIITEG